MAIRPDQNNLDEFVQLPAGIIPANLNPEFWIARTNDILGGPKIYPTLEEFVTLHPNLMQVGMNAVVNQHERGTETFKATIYKLDTIPTIEQLPLSISPNELDGAGNEVLDGNGNPIPVDNFFGNFWTVAQQFELSSVETTYQYAPDINGLRPPFPYLDNPDAESFWVDEYDPATSKWLRSRSTNRQDNNTGIYLDWTVPPLPINGNFEGGDYTQNLFRRAATEPQLPKATTKGGLPNNNPSGWQDIPPTNSTDPLYEIRGQKDKFGNLKSQWIGPFLIPEDANLIRYNSSATPNPNTLVDNTTDATEGSQADTDLINAGWLKTFDPTIHQYRAKRTDNGDGTYTTWDVTKISNESGEYIDRIYKLFPINTDFDNVTFINDNRPSGNDPISNTQELARNEDWFDTSENLNESSTQIVTYAQATKFFDGSLKTPWSPPKPFTGKDTYIDYIRSNGETSFKYTSSEDTTPDPATITLEFFLFKGNNEITSGLTYKWFKIYNNRNAIVVNPEVDTPLATTKTLTVNPAAVDTKAIFRCYATLEVPNGTDIVFTEEEPIVDITDGDDAKSLTLSSETPIVLYDTTNSEFSVDTIRLRAFQNFLTGVTFYWYKDDGAGNWVALAGNTDYTITNQSLSILADNTDPAGGLFVPDGTKQNARFAISTSDTLANVEDNDEFYDVFTISKLSSAGVGAAGQDAYTVVLSNEVDSIILDRATLLPQDGEIYSPTPTVDYGTVFTRVSLFDGITKRAAGTDFTITVASSETGISFTALDEGNDYLVYIDTWTADTVRKVTGVITIDIVGVTENIVKNFTVTSNLDDAGALIGFVDIAGDSLNQSLAFTPVNRDNIKLEAKLDQNGSIVTLDTQDNVNWFLDGAPADAGNVSGTPPIFKTITRQDVNGSSSVKAKITYNGQEYFTTPINIDDISDASNYILYHHFGTVPDEPIATPERPTGSGQPTGNVLVSEFENDFALTPSGTGYFREPAAKSYFYSIGQVEVINEVDTIVFNKALRFRGERGEQGPTPDFIVNYYKANNTGAVPTLPQSNASRQQMLNDGWFPTPAQTTGDFLFEAATTFNGVDLDNLNALATANWKIIQKNGEDGITPTVTVGTTTTGDAGTQASVTDSDAGDDVILDFTIPRGNKGDYREIRYQGSATNSFTGFDDSNRNAGTGWTTVRPGVDLFEYIFITEVYIDAELNTLNGTWSSPVLLSVNINTQNILNKISGTNQYLFENS